MAGKLFIVGMGPGDASQMTEGAVSAIEHSEVIIGFSLYTALLRRIFPEKKFISNGMQGEIERAKVAIEMAESGKNVAIVSSGDAGIYGIASPVIEIVSRRSSVGFELKIVPGLSASSAVSSILGAPLANDFITLSLSDLLTPLDLIMDRIEFAGKFDLVIVLYNPRGSRFPDNFSKAMDILKKYRKPETPVGIVRNAYRDKQSAKITNLASVNPEELDMLTTVVIGNSQTTVYKDLMYTKRGYSNKYDI
ncbi:MAG: precorrin-3B C(17)-methyltransferase [Thermoplasmatales archaeon]